MVRADLESAKALYPSCGMGVEEWVTFFNSPAGLGAFGKILYDIYDEVRSAEERNAGLRRIGRRPGRSAVPLDEVMGIVLPVEFTNDPLPVALPRLIAGRSQRAFALKAHITQSYLNKLLKGEREATTLELLEALATAAGVRPWYFVEWRARYIGTLMAEVLAESPHLSITAIRALRDSRRGRPLPKR